MPQLSLSKVAFLVLPNCIATSITLPLEMLSAAQSVALRDKNIFRIEKKLIGLEAGFVQVFGQLPIQVESAVDDLEDFDLIIVPGLWRYPHRLVKKYSKCIAWLREQHTRGACLVAAGTGVYLPACAGLLDGYAATTHWYFFDTFARNFPRIILKKNHRITESNRIYCAGSVNSVADLFVYLIELAFNRGIAEHVEQQFSYEIRQSYNSIAFSPTGNRHQDEVIMGIQQWIKTHLTQPISIRKLAQRADMSVRNFNRRFIRATDQTPIQYIKNLKIKFAQDLLRYSNLNICEIGAQIGYYDQSYFCRTFKKVTHQSPSAYRKKVRSKLFYLEE